MPAFRDDALCIRHWDWSETSQTVSLLTREHGVVRGLAKGAKRENAKFSGGIELLTRGQILYLSKPTTELATLTEWDLSELFPGLRTNLKRFHAGMYVADLLQHSIRDHDPHPLVFDAALACLRSLGGEQALRNAAGVDEALARFQWALLTEIGYRPQLSRDPRTDEPIAPSETFSFSPSLGGVVAAADAESWLVRGETVRCLRGLDAGQATEADETTWARASRLLAAYFREVVAQSVPSLPHVYPASFLPRPSRSS